MLGGGSGLNALIATVTTGAPAPVIVAPRLRKVSCGTPRGARRLVSDALSTVAKLRTGAGGTTALVRMDSAVLRPPHRGAVLRAGAEVSVTVRLGPKLKATISAIPEHGWTATGQWVSRAEVAEIAFASARAAERVPGRLVVRRSPDLNKAAAGRTPCSTPGADTRSSSRSTST